MILKFCSGSFLLILNFALAIATLHHMPPVSAVSGQPIEIEAVIMGEGRVVEARLFHRTVGQSGFQEVQMTMERGVWSGVISGGLVTKQGLEYAILLILDDGSTIAFPRENPLKSPYILNVTAAPERREPIQRGRSRGVSELKADVLIISPEGGEIVSPKDVLIVTSLFNIQGVDSSKVRLILDNRDVTSGAVISSDIITFSSPILSDGLHTVRIEMSNIYGYDLQPVTWSFTVASGGEALLAAVEEFEFGGRVRTDFSLDQVGRQLLSIGQTSTTLEGGWEWFNFRADVRLASDESELRQPRNRYSLTVESGDNISIRFGDFTPVLSPYTIDGKRIRGVGIDVDLKWLRFQVIKGELERSIQGLPDLDKSHRVLEIKSEGAGNPVYVLDRLGYTFSRAYQAYRLSANLFNRLQLGLNFQKAKDIKESVQQKIIQAKFEVPDWRNYVSEAGIDSGVYTFEEFEKAIEGIATYKLEEGNWRGANPQDNIVLGFDAGLSFDDRRLTFETAWAISLLNRNIWDGAMTTTQLDTALDDSVDGFVGRTYDDNGIVTGLGFSLENVMDPSSLKDMFIVNAHMVPLVPIDFDAFGETPVAAVMNMPSTAYHFKMRAYYYNNTIQLKYSQVGPEFNTLANPYLSKNLREFFFADRLRFLDNKLSLSFDYKHRDNKILRSIADPYSQNTISTNISFSPGMDLPSFSGSFQTVNRNNGKTELDTLYAISVEGDISYNLKDSREDTRTRNRYFSINVPIRSENRMYNFLVTHNSIDAVDLLETERTKDYTPSYSNSQSFSLVASIKRAGPLKSSITFSRYAIQIPLSATLSQIENESRLNSFAINATYTVQEKALKIQGGLSLLRASGISDFSYYGISTGLESRPFKSFVAKLTLSTKIKQVQGKTELGTLVVKFSANYVF